MTASLILLFAYSCGPEDFYDFNREAVPESTWEETRLLCSAFDEIATRLQTDDDFSGRAAGDLLHRLAEAHKPTYEAIPTNLSPSGVFGHVYHPLWSLGEMLKEGHPDPVEFGAEVRDVRGSCGALDRMAAGDWPVDGYLEYASTEGSLRWNSKRG